MDIIQKKCIPCNKNTPKITGEELKKHLSKLNGWQALEERHIEKTYLFKDFKQALNFTNSIGQIAENEGHHPDICLSWGKVKVILWTHKINGLSENDFIIAEKCDNQFKSYNL